MTAMIGLLLIGFCFTEFSGPPPEKNVQAMTPVLKAVLPARQEVHEPSARKIAEPTFQITADPPWRERLSALQGRGELFGQGAEERFKELTDFVEKFATADVPNAVRELQEIQAQNPTVTGRYLQAHLLRRWAESDLPTAIGWITQLPAGDERQEAITSAAGIWARQDFAEAARWAAHLPESAERQSARESVAAEAADANPLEALKLASVLLPSATRDDIITRAAAAWAAAAPEDATAWVQQIADPSLREQVIAGIAATWGEGDPVAAGNLAIQSLPRGALQDRTVMAIVQRWMQIDAKGAAAWVNQFPAGELRQTAVAMMSDYGARSQRIPPEAP
jgi:hypothetical protein